MSDLSERLIKASYAEVNELEDLLLEAAHEIEGLWSCLGSANEMILKLLNEEEDE